MEYQQPRSEVNHILQGVVSVLTARGEGISHAARFGNGWIPAGIAAVGGLRDGLWGVLWNLVIWVMLGLICWLMFITASPPNSPRPRIVDAIKMSGWCMLPLSIATLIFTLPTLLLNQPFVMLLLWLWMALALSAGWSAFTGVERTRTTVAAVLGVGITMFIQWFFLMTLFFTLSFFVIVTS